MTQGRIVACCGGFAVVAALAMLTYQLDRGAAKDPTDSAVATPVKLQQDTTPSVDHTQTERASAASEPNLPVVDVVLVRPVDRYTVGRSFVGTIVARRTSDLGFERSAKVVQLHVDEGDEVESGQPLATLDTRQLEIRKKQVAAQREEAVAILEELRAGPRVETIGAARATLNDAIAQVELQRRNYERLTRLLEQNAASKERFDAAELGLQSAEARLGVAQKQLDELEAGSRKEKIAAQEAVVAQLDATLEDIDVDLEDSVLVAPYAGKISRRYIDEGTVVAASQSILSLVESGVLEARIGLPVTVFDHVAVDGSFEIVVDGRSYPASLDRTLPDVDLQTRTRSAVFALERDAADRVVPGQVARIEIDQERPTDGFWLPTSALIRSYRGLWAVYVIEPSDDGRSVVRRRDVEVLHTDGEQTLVRGLLSEGDRVIRSGTHRVVPNQFVAIRSL